MSKFGLLFVGCALVALLAGCSREAREARYLREANSFYAAGDYDRAEIQYLNALRLNGSNGVALDSLGKMAFDQGNFSRAFALLSAARQLKAADTDAQLKLAMVLLAGGKVKEARDEALAVLEQEPTNGIALQLLADSSITTNDVRDAQSRLAGMPPAVRGLADYHLARGLLQVREARLPAAENSFREALAIAPQSSAAHMALGNLLLTRNDMTNAAAQFKAAAELAPPRSPYRLRYANFKLATGDTAGARAILEAVTKQAPDYLPALQALAQLALSQGHLQECEAMLKSLLGRDPANVDAIGLLARLRLAQDRSDQALVELENARRLAPRAPRISYQMALVYLQRNELGSAIRSLGEALRLQPGWVEAAMLRGELNIRRGDAATAITELSALAARHPSLASVQFLLASAHQAAGHLDTALGIYQALSRSFPTNPQPAFMTGLIYQRQGREAEARRSFEQALAAAPDFHAALDQLINLDLDRHQFAAAESRARQELQRAPSNAVPYELFGKIYLAETNLPEAESHLHRAIALAPDSASAKALLARVYVADKRYESALRTFNQLVAHDTNDISAWMQIAYLHNAASNHVAAAKAYETILEINPRYGLALNNLAYLCSERLGQPKRGYELASKARELLPNDPFTADTFGWVLYRNGDYPRALGLVQESARRLPEDPEVQFHLGMIHYMMGEELPARLALQGAMELGAPDANWRPEAAERLRILALDSNATNAAALKELESLRARFPQDPILLGRTAATAERAGQWQKAAQDYEKALTLNSNLVPAMVKLARLYASSLNDAPRAMALARRARNLDPDNPQVTHTLGRIAFDSARNAEDFKWAYSLLQESARDEAADAGVHFDLALAAYAVGNEADAVAAMQKVVAATPPSPNAGAARLFLEMHSLLTGPATNALSRVESVLRQQPDYVPALMVLGRLKANQGDATTAREIYEKALQQYPAFSPAYKPLALLYAGPLHDAQKAYDFASKAREAFPDDLQIARLLGGLAYQRGEFSSAIQLLKQSASAYPTDADLYYTLGFAQHKFKLGDDCKASLTRALALNPGSAFAEQARTILAGLK